MPNILSTSSSALLAFQRALATISHNVANAATPGYSRQTVQLNARPGQILSGDFIGSGVRMVGVQRLSDQFLTMRALDSGSETGRLQPLSSMAGRIDSTFSDAATSLSQPWSGFFDAAQSVSAQPASSAARQELLSSANSLVNRFRALDAQLDRQAIEVDQRLAAGIDDTNRLTGEIAEINKEIVRQTGLASGEPPNDLLDQRDRLVVELNTKTGVTTVEQDDGALNIFTTGGQALVVGTHATQFSLAADPYRPGRHELALASSSGTIKLASGSVSGELGGLLEFRDGTLDPAQQRLGRIAMTLAYEFNSVHRSGTDFYGDLGGDFFTAPQPSVSANANNTGAATLTATLDNPAALSGSDFILSFDGAGWSAADAATGTALSLSGTGTIADPLQIGGASIVVSGAAANGDLFLIQPSANAAGQMGMLITDPGRIAAALPVRASASVSNLGNASVDSLSIDDITNPALLNAVTIDFIDSNNYTVNGGPPVVYSGGDITVNGWRLSLEGTPLAGDTFQVAATGPGSSGNSNARLFAVLDKASVLDGGTASLNNAISALTSSIGSAARQSDYALQAQRIIDNQIAAERESVSGVNLDEEAANLLRYQQAYQASARMMSVADTLFQSLMAAMRN